MLLRPEGLAGRRVRPVAPGDDDLDSPRIEVEPPARAAALRDGSASVCRAARRRRARRSWTCEEVTRRFGGVVALTRSTSSCRGGPSSA